MEYGRSTIGIFMLDGWGSRWIGGQGGDVSAEEVIGVALGGVIRRF